MKIDFKALFEEMTNAAGKSLAKDGPKVRACVKQAFAVEKQALREIAEARLAGEITEAELKEQLVDEKDTLRAALLACEVQTKAAAQKAVNAALKVFSEAVKAALP
jgi:hypothetical protein